MAHATTDPHPTVIPHPAGNHGTLKTPAGQELPVRTYDRGEEVVLVVLTELDPLPLQTLDPATLEYTSLRGIIRLQGEAHFEDQMLVRFHAEGDPEVIQRRAYVRVHTPQEVTLGPTFADQTLHAHTIDISGGGMLLAGVSCVEVGDPIGFELRLGCDPAPVRGVARVVRIDPDSRRAVAFEEIDEGDRQRLIRFVFECMRTARAKTRGDLV
jgi:PilZ domain